MANITFLSFLLFSMCHSIHVAVNTWLAAVFFTLIGLKSRKARPRHATGERCGMGMVSSPQPGGFSTRERVPMATNVVLVLVIAGIFVIRFSNH